MSNPAYNAMTKEYAGLSAELDFWPSIEEMCQILRAGGFDLNVGKYAIRLKGCDDFVFREFGGTASSPCITASNQPASQLCDEAEQVSNALSAANIRHRIEVENGDDELVKYLHHKWPPNDV